MCTVVFSEPIYSFQPVSWGRDGVRLVLCRCLVEEDGLAMPRCR